MRRTFLIWLFAVICTAFMVTGLLVYSQFSRHARERAAQMISTRLDDMLELMLHADRATSFLSRVNDASTLDRTRALAEIVNLNPELFLNSQEALQGICNRLGAEQIAIADEDGTLVAAVPASNVGYNLAQGDDTRPFLACIAAPGYELCQRSSSADPNMQAMQYAGVHRLDQKGVVILGFRARIEHAAREAESLDRTSANLRMGVGGRIFVFRGGALLSSRDPAFATSDLLALPLGRAKELTVGDTDYYAYAVESGGYRIVGALPAAEVYRASVRAVQSILLSNLLLFIAMFAVVSYLLQRLVVRGIWQVNSTLRDITEGDWDKRVQVTDSPEFTRLSNGINFMVDSIKSLGEEQRKSMERDLELARIVQSKALPNKFPAFPNITAFDLSATCLQAHTVGGDFYDFFMPDDRHLHFLVADVNASGVPAALFMMRSLSTIRALARAAESPVSLVTQANRELCEGNSAGMRMALFYGCLDIQTGDLEYVNAGLLHTLLQRKGGEYEMLRGRADASVAVHPTAVYHASTLHLEPMDRIFLYTEGVVNATNDNNTPFGEGRLQEVLREVAPTAADALQQVRSALRVFTGEADLQKDVTMLCLEYHGALRKASRVLLPVEEQSKAVAFVASCMEAVFAAPSAIAEVQNSVRNVLTLLPQQSTVQLQAECDDERVELRIIFPAPYFNPLDRLADLPVDRVCFRYAEDKGNELTLWKNIG